MFPRNFQEALRRLEEARRWFQGHLCSACPLCLKVLRFWGEYAFQNFRVIYVPIVFFKILGSFMFRWFVKTQDSEHVSGSCRTAGL